MAAAPLAAGHDSGANTSSQYRSSALHFKLFLVIYILLNMGIPPQGIVFPCFPARIEIALYTGIFCGLLHKFAEFVEFVEFNSQFLRIKIFLFAHCQTESIFAILTLTSKIRKYFNSTKYSERSNFPKMAVDKDLVHMIKLHLKKMAHHRLSYWIPW